MIPIVRHLLVAAAALPLFALGQPAIQWQKCLGGSLLEWGETMVQTQDGGYVIAGNTYSIDGDVSGFHGGEILGDIWVVKVDALGTFQWQRCLGGSETDEAKSIQQTTDGGYVVAGSTNSSDGDVSGLHPGVFDMWGDAWVVKLDANGDIQWQRCLGGTWDDRAACIQQTADGGYILVGEAESSNGDVSGHMDNDDVWVVKLDPDGVLQWQRCLGSDGADRGSAIHEMADGGYIVVGRTRSEDIVGFHLPEDNHDVWVARLDATGDQQWQRCYGGAGRDYANSVQSTPDGGSVITGWTESNDGDVSGNHGGNGDCWVLKLDAGGGIEWQKCLGGSGTDEMYSIRTDSGGYILGGATTSTDGDLTGLSNGVGDAWVTQLNGSGAIQWQKCLGGPGSVGTSAKAVTQSADGGYAAAGGAGGNGGTVSGMHGAGDVWLVKLGPTVGITETDTRLFSVSPNPTNTRVTIGFPADARPTQITLLDVAGRLVSTQSMVPATVPFAMDLSAKETGLYLVQVRFADGTIVTQRLVKE